MRRLFLVFLVCGVAAFGSSALAQNALKIVAVVNDDVISLYDLQARLSLLIAGSNSPDSPETRRRLAPEVLRRMIDEVLQMQEAGRLSVTATQAEVDQAMANIERQNNMPKGGLERFLAQHGVDRQTLVAQIEAQIAWGKVMGRRLRPQIQIAPEEIDEAMARIEAGKGKPEYLLSEIFLRVDDTENESDIRQVAQRIMQQLQQGANFGALARNFSQAASATEGGNLGWVRPEDLADEIEQPVAQMQPGQFAGPIRTLSGFTIMLMRDRRTAAGLGGDDMEVQLQQLHFPLPANAPAAAVGEAGARAQAMAARAKSCADMEALAKEVATPMSGSLGKIKVSALPPTFRTAVRDLEIGRPTSPIRTESGLVVLMVCDRQGGANLAEHRQRIERMLTLQRLDVAAQRYLRDLRRAAFIDVRL